MRDLWRAIKLASVRKGLTAIAVSLSFAYTIINLIQPQILKKFFDLIEVNIRAGNLKTIPHEYWKYLIIFGIVIFAQDFVAQGSNYFIVKWWVETRKILQLKVFSHLESLSLGYFEKNSTGKIRERVDSGIRDLNNVMEGAVIDIAPQILFTVVALYFLFKINIIFGFLLLVAVPLFTIISFKFAPKLISTQDKARNKYERLGGATTESILNIRTIKSYATENKHLNKVNLLLKSIVNLEMKYIITRISMNTLRFFIVNLSQIAILGLGIYWALLGKITLGTFILAWQYTNKTINPLWYLTRVIDDIQKNMRSVRRVFELLDTESEVVDNPDAKKLIIKQGEIKFKNVLFKYKNGKRVIKDINLIVPAGKVVAIVGKSGTGKTTLVKLLLRFYDLHGGSIVVDGQDISKVTQKSLRESIGVVMQDSILFNATAEDNIRYGKQGSTMKNIQIAAKVANAHEFIEKLPKGYKTMVGERGVKLSGGEQQRINIARAILKNPPILVLDEATSSLDSESEKLIQDSLWKLIKGRTTLIIAHRLSTVMRADMIVVMDGGKIAEAGTHEELIKKKGIYSGLYDIQSGGYLNDETI